MKSIRTDAVNPPLDGSITIPELLDFHYAHNAERPMYVFSPDGTDEIIEVSYLEFGRACDRVAYALRPQPDLDVLGQEKQVVAFIALADTIVYQAVTVGMMRAGLVVRQVISLFFRRTHWQAVYISHFQFLHGIPQQPSSTFCRKPRAAG